MASEKKKKSKGGKRKLSNPVINKAITVLCVILTIYFVWASVFGFPDAILYRSVFVTAMVGLTLLLFAPEWGKKDKVGVVDWILFGLAVAVAIYVATQGQRYIWRVPFQDEVTMLDKVAGIVMVLLVLEATRRAIGYPLLIVAGIMLLYPFLGKYIPGLFGHRGFAFKQIVEQLFMTTNGIYGEAIGISSSYVFMFVVFGAFLNATGGGDYFFDLSRSIAGSARGGYAKTAVVASCLFGSISGSPISNVATTGAMTIPMMKKSGYPAYFAGAVETAASCGGTIMPPVMGAVAFLMAEVMGTTYNKVILAAAIPAVLYYFAVFFSVDIMAVRMHLKGEPKGSLPSVWKVFISGIQYVLPLAWLVFRLFQGLSASRVAFESIILMVVVALIVRSPKYPINIKMLIKACEDSVKSTMKVAVACAAAGVVVAVLNLTGLGGKFTSLILSLGQNHLILALLLTMVVTIILGMGMSISPTYLLAASLCAPALIKAGLNPMAAHMFILYYAAMATMTPPVALAAYTAAGIAEADPMKVGWTAVRLGVVAFIIPYVFVYQPWIILQFENSTVLNTVASIAFTAAAVVSLAAGLNQYLFRNSKKWESIAFLVAAAAMLVPYYGPNVAGLVLLVVVSILQIRDAKKGIGVEKIDDDPPAPPQEVPVTE